MRPGVRAATIVCAAITTIAPAAASATTQVVYAGGPPSFQKALGKSYGAEALDFFPHKLTINAGDTVSWQGMSIGFYTIDLPAKGGTDLPLIVPRGGTTNGVTDAAGSPFWFDNGSVPMVGFNPALFAPSGGHSYNGTTRLESGLPLGPAKPFNVKFLRPGTYEYFCNVHYDMRGIIVVKPKGRSVPSAAAVKAEVAKQVARDTGDAKALVKKSKTLPANQVSVGFGGKDYVEMLAMLPGTITVSLGTTVSFSMSPLTGETHTVTFGPQSVLTGLGAGFNGASPFDPRAVFPSSPPGTAIPVSTTAHGDGFANSGALDQDKATTTVPPGAKFTFTAPGTYRFVCLIHPFMHGTVIVK